MLKKASSLILLLSLSGCIHPIAEVFHLPNYIEDAFDQSKELDKPPFAMPKEFPVPPDAVTTQRPLKGTSISFQTKLTLREINKWYVQALESYGLYYDCRYVVTQPDVLSFSFMGWPGGCWLTISAVDLAYSGQDDRRSVSADLVRCR